MVIWLVGLSGSGKTSIGREVFKLIKTRKSNVVFIDGDEIRQIMGNDLGHSLVDRRRNADRISKFCKFLDSQGIDVVCAILSIFEESRIWNRQNITNYFEVFLSVSMEVLKTRDKKGLYEKALRGDIKDVVGVDLEFSPPSNPHLVIDNNVCLESYEDPANKIIEAVDRLGFIS